MKRKLNSQTGGESMGYITHGGMSLGRRAGVVTNTSFPASLSSRLIGREEMCAAELVHLDHAYAKAWSEHPEASHARAAIYLCMRKPSARAKMTSVEDDHLDVETVAPEKPVTYDPIKAASLMNDSLKHVTATHPSNSAVEDLEPSEEGWSLVQASLYRKVMGCLKADRLSRLACEGKLNEALLRRLAINRSAKRIRLAFGAVKWDVPVLTWLHSILTTHLGHHMLSAYLDIMQTIHSKVQTLISPIMNSDGSGEVVSLLMKKSWDPIISATSHIKPKRLPGNPLIIVAPSSPWDTPDSTRRLRFWKTYLGHMGKVAHVHLHLSPERWAGGGQLSVRQCLDHMVRALKIKVQEMKNHFPGRPIVLIGWNVGAVVASYVAKAESVSANVCLGFPILGLNGLRGDVDDCLLDLKVPTLFVIGQYARTTPLDDMEDMREKMAAENSLLVVGSADDYLNVSHKKKKEEGVTQVVIDRCIHDQINSFLGGVLSVLVTTSTIDMEYEKGRKRRRKELVTTLPHHDKRSKITGVESLRLANIIKGPATQEGVSIGRGHGTALIMRHDSTSSTPRTLTPILPNLVSDTNKRGEEGISTVLVSNGVITTTASDTFTAAGKRQMLQFISTPVSGDTADMGQRTTGGGAHVRPATVELCRTISGGGNKAGPTLHHLNDGSSESTFLVPATATSAIQGGRQQIRHLLTIDGSTSLLLASHPHTGHSGSRSQTPDTISDFASSKSSDCMILTGSTAARPSAFTQQATSRVRVEREMAESHSSRAAVALSPLLPANSSGTVTAPTQLFPIRSSCGTVSPAILKPVAVGLTSSVPGGSASTGLTVGNTLSAYSSTSRGKSLLVRGDTHPLTTDRAIQPIAARLTSDTRLTSDAAMKSNKTTTTFLLKVNSSDGASVLPSIPVTSVRSINSRTSMPTTASSQQVLLPVDRTVSYVPNVTVRDPTWLSSPSNVESYTGSGISESSAMVCRQQVASHYLVEEPGLTQEVADTPAAGEVSVSDLGNQDQV